jgi:hypothetical protein
VSVPVTFRVSPEVKEQLRQISVRANLPLGEVVRRQLGVAQYAADDYQRGVADGSLLAVPCAECGGPISVTRAAAQEMIRRRAPLVHHLRRCPARPIPP